MHKKSIWIYLKIYSFLLYYVINAKEEVKCYEVIYEKSFENYLKILENKNLANDIQEFYIFRLNERDLYTEEDGVKHSTLLYDIVLDNEVPEDYYMDFEIPKKAQ